jgi:hypothetical protein
MGDMMDDKITRVTTFDLRSYAGGDHNFNRDRPHPANHRLVLRSGDGTERSIDLAQLEVFLKYAAELPHMGSALDAVAQAANKRLRDNLSPSDGKTGGGG